MSREYRFEPPTLQELESWSEWTCPYNYHCDNCEFDCEVEQ